MRYTKLTPNELKELAEVVEKIPNNYGWIATSQGRVIQTAIDEDGLHLLSDFIYEPYKPTERGKAQLCDVIFATYKTIGMKRRGMGKYNELTGRLLDGLILGDPNIILRLAHDVLIKKGE